MYEWWSRTVCLSAASCANEREQEKGRSEREERDIIASFTSSQLTIRAFRHRQAVPRDASLVNTIGGQGAAFSLCLSSSTPSSSAPPSLHRFLPFHPVFVHPCLLVFTAHLFIFPFVLVTSLRYMLFSHTCPIALTFPALHAYFRTTPGLEAGLSELKRQQNTKWRVRHGERERRGEGEECNDVTAQTWSTYITRLHVSASLSSSRVNGYVCDSFMHVFSETKQYCFIRSVNDW